MLRQFFTTKGVERMDEIKKSHWGQDSKNPAYNQAVDVGYACGKKYIEGAFASLDSWLHLSNVVAMAVSMFQDGKRGRKFRGPPGTSKKDRDLGAAEGFGDGFIHGVMYAVGIRNPNYRWNRKLLGWTLSESISIDPPPEDAERQ